MNVQSEGHYHTVSQSLLIILHDNDRLTVQYSTYYMATEEIYIQNLLCPLYISSKCTFLCRAHFFFVVFMFRLKIKSFISILIKN